MVLVLLKALLFCLKLRMIECLKVNSVQVGSDVSLINLWNVLVWTLPSVHHDFAEAHRFLFREFILIWIFNAHFLILLITLRKDVLGSRLQSILYSCKVWTSIREHGRRWSAIVLLSLAHAVVFWWIEADSLAGNVGRLRARLVQTLVHMVVVLRG